VRIVRRSRAAATVHEAPAFMAIDQIARSDSGSAPHECGGGGSGSTSPSVPAMTMTSTPGERCRGMSLAHSIVK
jgi:hypothetical protein